MKKYMSKAEFFKIWNEHCDRYELGTAEGLVTAVGSNELDLDSLEDEALRKRLDNAFGRFIVSQDDIVDVFMDLEKESHGLD